MSAPVTPSLDTLLSAAGSHCRGCYNPELCPGVDPRTHHCEDCVLDDEFCEGIIAEGRA